MHKGLYQLTQILKLEFNFYTFKCLFTFTAFIELLSRVAVHFKERPHVML